LECFALHFTWVRTAYMRKARFHKSRFSHQTNKGTLQRALVCFMLSLPMPNPSNS